MKTFIHLLLASILLLQACRPAKQVTKQDADISALKNKWEQEWLKNNPCPQLPEINLDSICELVGYSYQEPAYDSKEDKKPVVGSDSSSKLITSAKEKASIPCKPKNVLIPGPPDTKQLNALKDTVALLRQQLAFCNGKHEGKKPELVKYGKWKWNNWSWLFFGFVSSLFLIAFLSIKKRMRKNAAT